MAANSNSRGIAVLGKQVVSRICTPNSPHQTSLAPSVSFLTIRRRATYSSLYEKNLDDQVRPTVVPEDVIQAAHSDKYWAPHPQTGIFGPTTDHTTPTTTVAAGGGRNSSSALTTDAGAASVLEENAWFRPTSLEDVEKPHHLY